MTAQEIAENERLEKKWLEQQESQSSQTFTPAQLETAANVFIQKNGRNQESDWRWERTEMLHQFIAGLFKEAKTPTAGNELPCFKIAAPGGERINPLSFVLTTELITRWERLTSRGVEFSTPPARAGFFGLRMTVEKQGSSFLIHAPSDFSSSRMQTRILELCEHFSQVLPPTTPR